MLLNRATYFVGLLEVYMESFLYDAYNPFMLFYVMTLALEIHFKLLDP